MIHIGMRGGIMFNPYANSHEDVSLGERHIAMMVPVVQVGAFETQKLIKYPPQSKIGILSNVPPVHDQLR